MTRLLLSVCVFTAINEGSLAIRSLGLVHPETPIHPRVLARVPDVVGVSFPPFFDWRDEIGDIPVRDQGTTCGSSWAFGTIASIEYLIKNQTGQVVDLAEQQLVSCDKSNHGCQGGWWGFNYLLENGPANEDCFPHTETDGVCKSCPSGWKVASWDYVSGAGAFPTVQQIKAAVYQNGPVVSGVAVTAPFYTYTGGVYDVTTGAETNHAVVIVGWNDDAQSWIIRNSWGTAWGESGYMLIKWTSASIGSGAAYSVVTPAGGPATAAAASKFVVTARCTPISGFFVQADVDHVGHDLNLNNRYSSNGIAAAACSANRQCMGFNTDGYIKYYVYGVRPAPGYCLYTKDCPLIGGYVVQKNVDHWNNDIYTTPYVNLNAAAAACSADRNCQGFNTDGYIKYTTASVTSSPGYCLYTKGFMLSPYKDVGLGMDWNTHTLGTSIYSPPRPLPDALPAGMDVMTWGFAVGTCGKETWAGIPADTFANANVNRWRMANKRYIISTGGRDGKFQCTSDADFEVFINRYLSLNMVGVDFDIENSGGATYDDVYQLVKRVVAARWKYPHLRWSFTVPVGGTSTLYGEKLIYVLDSILSMQVSWTSLFINLMVMNYGNPPSSTTCSIWPNGYCDMVQSAQRGVNAVHFDPTQPIFGKYFVPYSAIEVTPMIGKNDNSFQVFTVSDARNLARYVRDMGLAGLHYWAFDRDRDCIFANDQLYSCNKLGYTAGTFAFFNEFLLNSRRIAAAPAVPAHRESPDSSPKSPNASSTPRPNPSWSPNPKTSASPSPRQNSSFASASPKQNFSFSSSARRSSSFSPNLNTSHSPSARQNANTTFSPFHSVHNASLHPRHSREVENHTTNSTSTNTDANVARRVIQISDQLSSDASVSLSGSSFTPYRTLLLLACGLAIVCLARQLALHGTLKPAHGVPADAVEGV